LADSYGKGRIDTDGGGGDEGVGEAIEEKLKVEYSGESDMREHRSGLLRWSRMWLVRLLT
jgi:hypothetical protein